MQNNDHTHHQSNYTKITRLDYQARFHCFSARLTYRAPLYQIFDVRVLSLINELKFAAGHFAKVSEMTIPAAMATDFGLNRLDLFETQLFYVKED